MYSIYNFKYMFLNKIIHLKIQKFKFKKNIVIVKYSFLVLFNKLMFSVMS